MDDQIQGLDERLTALRAEADELASLEAPNEEQLARMDALPTEFDEVTAQRAAIVTRAENLARVRAAAENPVNRERAFSAPDIHIKNRRDPFDSMDLIRSGMMPASEVCSRAQDAIEASPYLAGDAAEHVTRLTEGRGHNGVTRADSARISRHILETGTEEYHDNFVRYMEDPEGYAARAAMSLTSANGGYLLPYVLDPTVILTNNGSANPFRQISNVITTSSNTWNGVTSAGVSAGWLAEGTEDSDHSPTFGNIQITPQKASAWVFGSYEVLEDTDISGQLPRLLTDAKDRLEEAAFATGTGSGQPYGVVTRATAVTSAGAGAFAVADVYAVQAALPARFRGPMASNHWVANLGIINRIRQFDTAGGSSFWANLGMNQPEELLGKPIHESTTMTSNITTGSKNLLLGDFKQYNIVDRIGMSVLYEPLVKGSNQRPTGQAGWFAFWRVGADVTTASAFRVLTEG